MAASAIHSADVHDIFQKELTRPIFFAKLKLSDNSAIGYMLSAESGKEVKGL